MKRKVFTTLVLIILASCGGGLEPPDPNAAAVKARLTGTIKYLGGAQAWPRPYLNPDVDSVYEVRLAAFKSFPPADIVLEVLTGNALLTNALPRFVDSSDFSIEIDELPLELQYIAVAQQYDSSIIEHWRVIGVYTLSGDNAEHTSLTLDENRDYNVRINVDWDDLPPQPF